MAVLGKIRSRGVILICIIGFGLFAFIAEELFRSCESTKNDQRQQIGEVLGEKVNVQEFQKLMDEYSEVIKMQQGVESLSEDQLNQVKDQVWNTYVSTKIIENEAKELGLRVTDEEVQNVLTQGTNPLLQQTPFVNQQTGRFDVNALKKFLSEYKTQKTANPQLAQQYQSIYNYWSFIEKTLRQQLLSQKYQSLLGSCFLSNKVEAKAAFKENTEESQIQLAAFPFSDIANDKVKVSDEDLKKKYEEKKQLFRQEVETRDVKYVDFQVDASPADRAALNKDFAQYAAQLATSADPTEAVRKATSQVPYLGLPVKKDAFPQDIAQMLDSMAVGTTSKVFESKGDNTLNVIKLLSKTSLPDSIQYRQINVGAETPEKAHQLADSIMNALKAGADFEVLAKKYNQTGEKVWLTTAQYQNSNSVDENTKKYLLALNYGTPGQLQNIDVEQGNVIVQVLDKKAPVDKYVAAVVKKTIDFSRNTYSAAYNKFSSFVSANQTKEGIEKNAQKNGYTVQDAPNISTANHGIANIRNTREALKWVFDAKEGDVSPMYECGENNHLMVAVLVKINPAGYLTLENEQVKKYVTELCQNDKKAEMIQQKLQGVKSVAQAKAKGAKVAPVNQITFSSPVFVQTTGASEPALAGAVAATKKGQFVKKPVVGFQGVYVFQVTNKTTRPEKYNQKAVEDALRQQSMQYAGNFFQELYGNAKVVDNRYLFF